MIKNIIRKIDNRLFAHFLPIDDSQLSYCLDVMLYSNPKANKWIPETLAQYLEDCNKWLLRQLHYCHQGTCILEPDLGWAVTKKWEVIPYSNYNLYIHQYDPPLYSKFLVRLKKTVALDEVISLKYVWNNYGHFMNDIMGQVHLAESLGITDAQLVIPKGVLQKTYFADFLKLSSKFKSKKWFFQEEGMYIESGKAHFMNTWFSHRVNFDATIDLLDAEVVARTEQGGNNKIFVGRKYTRKVTNLDEILKILSRYGYQYTEVEGKSLEEQIKLFTNASHVIGIHGAALTNIIFRRNKPLKFLELYSDCYLDPFYYWICVQYNFEYAAMLCKSSENLPKEKDWHTRYVVSPFVDMQVDPVVFEKMLNEFMA